MTPATSETYAAAQSVGWNFSYDASQFIALPLAEELAADPTGQLWVDAALTHYQQDGQLTPGDREAITFTARALLEFVEPFVARFWFTPPAQYSDVVLSIVVTAADGEIPGMLAEELAVAPQATASEAIPIETDTHGSGVLIRRTSAVPTGDREGMLVAHWDLLLSTGPWFIAVNATGTTLDVFGQLESLLLSFVTGITFTMNTEVSV